MRGGDTSLGWECPWQGSQPKDFHPGQAGASVGGTVDNKSRVISRVLRPVPMGGTAMTNHNRPNDAPASGFCKSRTRVALIALPAMAAILLGHGRAAVLIASAMA